AAFPVRSGLHAARARRIRAIPRAVSRPSESRGGAACARPGKGPSGQEGLRERPHLPEARPARTGSVLLPPGAGAVSGDETAQGGEGGRGKGLFEARSLGRSAGQLRERAPGESTRRGVARGDEGARGSEEEAPPVGRAGAGPRQRGRVVTVKRVG